MRQLTVALAACLLLTACNNRKNADLLVVNARIYTVDSSFNTVEAMAIKDGKILATGSTATISAEYNAPEKLDAGGKAIFPGFIDAHAHFYQYGLGLQTADLTGTDSWQAILDSLVSFSKTHPEGWLIGRGWDQNDWAQKDFPDNAELNRLFPDRPVLLSRVDGHAAMANAFALNLAGLQPGVQLTGGDVVVKKGSLTGLLIDNAVDLVAGKVPAPDAKMTTTALKQAQENCFAVGLTTVDDCGIMANAIETIDSLQKAKILKMRIYAMISDAAANYEWAFRKGKWKTDRLNVRSFKVYGDGALGSRGACLLAPYSDRAGHYGFLLSQPAHYDSIARLLLEKDFQLCTHAIGDSGNRIILQTYAKYLQGKNDKRWRIEHAQVISPDDFAKFGAFNIIPSVQPTHATSDMYWAADRLGTERVKGAYAYKQLLQQNGWIALGTDFPVEDISPFKTFYAAVERKDAKGFPDGGFQSANALSREETIRGMTIWAAKANFEETEKGSLEASKLADFILLDTDLLTAPANQVLQTKVIRTYLNGEPVFVR